MKTLTNAWFKKNNACIDGYKWVLSRNYDNSLKTLQELINIKRVDWANWTIVRMMNKEQKIQYAVFAAEQVLHIFEEKYPDDDRPRKAIEAAKLVLIKNNKENRNTAYAAAAAAAVAAYAADSVAAAHAAYAAAAVAAADSADSTNAAAYAYAAYAAADAYKRKMQIQILNYGLTMLHLGEISIS